MKILFDLSGCEFRHNAITVYSLRILTGFKENNYKDITILCNALIYDYVSTSFPEYSCVKISMLKMKSVKNIFYNYLNWKKQVEKINCDIIFMPHVFPPFTCFLLQKKVVLVFHDLQGLSIYKGVRLWICRIIYPFALMKSQKIITISYFVERAIHRIYPFISQKKIHTVYNGVAVRNEKRQIPLVKTKYLLYVSSLMPHKNIITLLKAFSVIKEQIPHVLVIIGKPTDYWEKVALSFIEANHLESRIHHISNPVSDEALVQYYQFADLFIHPSLMEGFGYTPIEAAMYEVPVLTNKETALYETTLGLLNYYEPATDEIAMSQQIVSLLKTPPTPERLKEISQIFQQKYDCREQAKKIYDKLLSVKP